MYRSLLIKFLLILLLASNLTSCFLFRLDNQCAVEYEQNLELTIPPVVPEDPNADTTTDEKPTTPTTTYPQ